MVHSRELSPTRDGKTELPHPNPTTSDHRWRDSNVITWPKDSKQSPKDSRDAPDTHADSPPTDKMPKPSGDLLNKDSRDAPDSRSTDKMPEPSGDLLNSESGRLFERYLDDRKEGRNKLSPEGKAEYKIEEAFFSTEAHLALCVILDSIRNTKRTSLQVRHNNGTVVYLVGLLHRDTRIKIIEEQAQHITLERRRGIIKGTLNDKPFAEQRDVWEQYKTDLSDNSDYISDNVMQEESAWADLELESLSRREMKDNAHELIPEEKSKMWDKWHEDDNKMSKITIEVERDRLIEEIESQQLEPTDARLEWEDWIRSLHPDVRDKETKTMEKTFKEKWRDHKEQDPEPSKDLLNSESGRLFKGYLFERKMGRNRLNPEQKAIHEVRNYGFDDHERTMLYQLFDSLNPTWTSPATQRINDSMEHQLKHLHTFSRANESGKEQGQRLVLERRRGIIKGTLKGKPYTERRSVWEKYKLDLSRISRNSDYISDNVMQEESAWADLELELINREVMRQKTYGKISGKISGKMSDEMFREISDEMSEMWDKWHENGNKMSKLTVEVERDELTEKIKRRGQGSTGIRRAWEDWIRSLHPDIRDKETQTMEQTLKERKEREERYQQEQAATARTTGTMETSPFRIRNLGATRITPEDAALDKRIIEVMKKTTPTLNNALQRALEATRRNQQSNASGTKDTEKTPEEGGKDG